MALIEAPPITQDRPTSRKEIQAQENAVEAWFAEQDLLSKPMVIEKDYSQFTGVEDLAAHLGKPVDEILEVTGCQFFAGDLLPENLASAKKQAQRLIEDYLLPLNRQHALINVGGSFAVADFLSLTPPKSRNPAAKGAWIPRSMPDMHSLQDFAVRYEDRKVSVIKGEKYVSRKVADVWREWRYRRIYPRALILAPGVNQRDLPESFNLWRGWGLDVDPSEPHCPEAWATLRKHFEEAYFADSPRLLEWFYSWLADIFTNPMSKPGSAIVLRGLKGTGKSLLADVLKELVGLPYYVRLDKPSQMTGTFNGHLLSTLLVNVEEAFFSGDKAAEGALKSWITSEDVQIRLMRTDGFQARNYSRFLFTSNNDWVVPATHDERRFFVIDVSDKFRGDDEHFSLLWEELKRGGGLEEFLKFLLTWKKPKWVKLNQPPKTQALARQVEESLSIPERFFWNAVKTGQSYPCPDGGEFYSSEALAQYDNWVLRYGSKYDASNVRKFGLLIEKYWHTKKVGRRTNPDTGNKETVYKALPLTELREMLMEEFDLHDEAFDCEDNAAD